jgi:pyrimidine-nucleoside phosphorylase
VVVEIPADEAGFVTRIDAMEIGLAAVTMGAGRTRADQKVDPAVGIDLPVARGDRVERGAPLARLHVQRSDHADLVRARVRAAFSIGDHAAELPPLVLDRIG